MAVAELDQNQVDQHHGKETEALKRRRPLQIFLFVLLVMLLIFAAIVASAYYLNSPVSPSNVRGGQTADSSGEGAVFTVQRGESADVIASRLQQEHIIRAAFMLKLVSRIQGTGADFQAGQYRLSPAMTTLEVHNTLVDGRQVLVRVTIPEGFTLRQVADRMQRAGITSADDFISAATSRALLDRYDIPGDSAEGYLFPDTYLFSQGYPASQVVSHMIDTFFKRLSTIYPDYRSLTAEQLHDKVVLASIVEREYVSPDEAPLIASVFYNRLERHIRLESCATVAYVMTEQDGLPHPDRIFDSDLKRPSPYNTYLHGGLPPGAISNPGITSLDAAFHPAKSDYLYFVLKASGAQHHNFSRTLAEHDQQAVFYLKTLQSGS